MNMELGFDVETATPSPALAAMPQAEKPRVWTVFAAWFVAALVGQIAVLATFILAGAAIGIVLGIQGVDQATISPRITAMLTQPLPMLLLSLLPFQLVLLLVFALAA